MASSVMAIIPGQISAAEVAEVLRTEHGADDVKVSATGTPHFSYVFFTGNTGANRALCVFDAADPAFMTNYKDVHNGPATMVSMGRCEEAELAIRCLLARYSGYLLADDGVDHEWEAVDATSPLSSAEAVQFRLRLASTAAADAAVKSLGDGVPIDRNVLERSMLKLLSKHLEWSLTTKSMQVEMLAHADAVTFKPEGFYFDAAVAAITDVLKAHDSPQGQEMDDLEVSMHEVISTFPGLREFVEARLADGYKPESLQVDTDGQSAHTSQDALDGVRGGLSDMSVEVRAFMSAAGRLAIVGAVAAVTLQEYDGKMIDGALDACREAIVGLRQASPGSTPGA